MILIRSVVVLAVVLAGGSCTWAQSVQVTDIQATSTNMTYVNGGGFSIMSDGGLSYGGPINAITPLDTAMAVRLVINDQVLLDGVPAAAQALVDSGLGRINSLSPELGAARMDVAVADRVSLGIGGHVPMPIAIGGRIESLRSVQMDGQSWSVFPDLQPSVFNRSVVEQ